MGILNKLMGGGSSTKVSSDMLFNQAEAKLRSGDSASAITLFSQMLKQAESEGVGKPMRDRLYNFVVAIHNGAAHLNTQAGGNIYFSAGLAELDVEISITEMLLKYEPNAPDLWSGLGLAYDNRGHCRLAEPCYRKAIALDPQGVVAADAWMNIGVLYRNYARTIGKKDHEIPLAGLRKEQLFPTAGSSIAINGNFGSPHWKTAEAAFEQALSIYTKFASRDAQFRADLVKAHWNLAQLYTDLVQGSKAIPHVQAIYRLEPGNQKAIDWLKEAERNTGKQLL
jgi:tetratricopeptide (TPR) repeat protein